MHKFRFRLQTVLEYREELEQQAKSAYGAAQARRIEVEEEMREVDQVRGENLKSKPASLPEHLALEAWLNNLDDRQRQMEVLRAILLEEEDTARLAWIETKREAEVLQKLRTKQKDEYDLELSRFEQAQLDEWATMRRSAA